MTAEAIRVFNEDLDEELALASVQHLTDQQRRRGLFFGNRPLCTVLRPRFLSTRQYAFLQQRVGVLLRAFARIQKLAVHSPEFRQQFRLDPWEDELMEVQTGLACDYPTSRLDAFFVSESELKFTEFNAETPAATAYGDALSDLFFGLPVMAEFQRKYIVRPLPTRPGVLYALLDAYRNWIGRRFAQPTIAILDWKEVPTYSEFVLFREYFQSQGLECVIADPRELEYREGKLWAEGLAVDLIYKRVLLSELVERGGIDHPVLRAVRAGSACMVNSHRAKALYKKASFAVLSDERNQRIFDADERAVISDHIPWTRVVEDRMTEFRGEEIDLLPWIENNRDRLVLKPNDDYGGKGVILGWKQSMEDWQAALKRASTAPHVVQERIRLPSEPFPSVDDGVLTFHERLVDTDPFGVHGLYMEGCLTRISTDDLVNVTAGGGSTVPTFVVEARL